MRFFQRGRGQTQSSRRAERDTQLVLLDRIDDLNRTIDDLTTQIDNENMYFSDRHSLARRPGYGLERQRLVAIRKRDQAMEDLLNAPVADARTFGKNAPAAGGRKTRRKRARRRRTRRR